MDMEGTYVECVLFGIGSNVNILYKDVFDMLGIDKARMKPTRMSLSGFTGDKVEVEGTIELHVELGSLLL